MAGETELHRSLKKAACRWLFDGGYGCVAAEVNLRPLGIIDAVGTGVFGTAANHFGVKRKVHQTCFIECKASRSDYQRDLTADGQMQLCQMERRNNPRRKTKALSQTVGLGKFAACLLHPMANLHYVLSPQGLIHKKDLPPRWGLLTLGDGGISVVVRAVWQESTAGQSVETAIARTLTGDLYRAGERALSSINRELQKQQQAVVEKIRELRPLVTDIQTNVYDVDESTLLPFEVDP